MPPAARPARRRSRGTFRRRSPRLSKDTASCWKCEGSRPDGEAAGKAPTPARRATGVDGDARRRRRPPAPPPCSGATMCANALVRRSPSQPASNLLAKACRAAAIGRAGNARSARCIVSTDPAHVPAVPRAQPRDARAEKRALIARPRQARRPGRASSNMCMRVATGRSARWRWKKQVCSSAPTIFAVSPPISRAPWPKAVGLDPQGRVPSRAEAPSTGLTALFSYRKDGLIRSAATSLCRLAQIWGKGGTMPARRRHVDESPSDARGSLSCSQRLYSLSAAFATNRRTALALTLQVPRRTPCPSIRGKSASSTR